MSNEKKCPNVPIHDADILCTWDPSIPEENFYNCKEHPEHDPHYSAEVMLLYEWPVIATETNWNAVVYTLAENVLKDGLELHANYKFVFQTDDIIKYVISGWIRIKDKNIKKEKLCRFSILETRVKNCKKFIIDNYFTSSDCGSFNVLIDFELTNPDAGLGWATHLYRMTSAKIYLWLVRPMAFDEVLPWGYEILGKPKHNHHKLKKDFFNPIKRPPHITDSDDKIVYPSIPNYAFHLHYRKDMELGETSEKVMVKELKKNLDLRAKCSETLSYGRYFLNYFVYILASQMKCLGSAKLTGINNGFELFVDCLYQFDDVWYYLPKRNKVPWIMSEKDLSSVKMIDKVSEGDLEEFLNIVHRVKDLLDVYAEGMTKVRNFLENNNYPDMDLFRPFLELIDWVFGLSKSFSYHTSPELQKMKGAKVQDCHICLVIIAETLNAVKFLRYAYW